MKTQKFLITGYGRSGTKYMGKLLEKNGIDAPHENVGKDGAVSWLHIVDGEWTNKIKVEASDFDPIIHMVRDPLKVISSAMTIRQHSLDYMLNALGVGLERKDKLFQVMYTYVAWNKMVEERAVYRFRIEDIKTELPNILKIIGISIAKAVFKGMRTNINSRKSRYTPLTWEDLRKCSPPLYNKILKMREDYGY